MQGDRSKGLWYVRDESAAAARAIVRAWKRGSTDYGTIKVTPRSKRVPVVEGARQFEAVEATYDDDDRSADVPVVEWLEGDSLDVVSAIDAPWKPRQRQVAKAIREILLLAKHGWAPRTKIHKLRDAWYKSPVYQTLEAQDGVLLDGTPNRGLMRLAGITVGSEISKPYDATANVTRTWFPCGNAYGEARTRRPHANRKALLRSVWNGTRFDDKHKHELPEGVISVDWPRVLTAMRRASTAAERAGRPHAWVFFCDLPIERVILETMEDGARVFTDVIEQRDVAELAAQEVERLLALQECRRLARAGGTEGPARVAHFGNARSRNDWVDVVALSVLGTPYLGVMKQLAALRIERDDDPDHYDMLRDEGAAIELCQVVERSRSTRRTDSAETLFLYVESDVCPVGPWAETAPFVAPDGARGWSPLGSDCRHEYREQTEARLAGVIEDILAERGEGFAGELAAEMGITVKALAKYRAAGALPSGHEGALLPLVPGPEWRRPVLAPLPAQDVLRGLVGSLDRQVVANILGVTVQHVSKWKLGRREIPESAARVILRLAEGQGTRNAGD